MKTLLIKIAQRCNHVEILTSNMTCKKTTTTMTKKKKKQSQSFCLILFSDEYCAGPQQM